MVECSKSEKGEKNEKSYIDDGTIVFSRMR